MRIARAKAKEWNIDPQRIGIMGFSAGGHVAATVGTHFDAGDPKAADPIEQVSCRPDFLVLVYPVITMSDQGGGVCRETLLGKTPAAADIDFVSNEKQVTDADPANVPGALEDRSACPRAAQPPVLRGAESASGAG